MTNFFTYSPEKEDYHIILHRDRPLWLRVNNSALEIAKQLGTGKPRDDTANQLAEEYGISRDTAYKDVLYVLNLLKQHDFLSSENIFRQRIPIFKSLYLHLTSRCNLSCLQCYVAEKRNPTLKDLPLSLVLRMIDELTDNRGKEIVLSGGEPMLYPEIKQVIEYACSKVKIRFLTNGTLITKEWASFFADKDMAVQISIDGSKKEIHDAVRGSGNFEKAVRAVQYLQDAGLSARLNLSTTVMKQNIHDLPEIILLAEKLGVPKVRFLPLRRTGRAERLWESVSENKTGYENFFSYVKSLQKNKRTVIDISCGLSGFMLYIPENVSDDDLWCPVGKMAVVGITGDVYPCALLMNEEFRLGNVFTESLCQIIKSEKMKNLCKSLSERRNRIGKCSLCNWRNFCQGGCMGQAFEHKGTIWDCDDFCGYRQNAYAEAFDSFPG